MVAPSKDRRLYARFHIGFDEHDKIFPLSDAAFRALVEATLYGRRQLTDGFLAERLAIKRWGAEVLEELSTNDPERPSLVRVEGGWMVHDFAEHQTTNADIAAKREAGARAVAKRWDKHRNSEPIGDLIRIDRSTLAKTETKTKTKEENVADARADVMILCDLLADLIAENGSPRPAVSKAWMDAARLMLDKDHRELDKASNLIRWSQEHSFWRSAVMSMPKFREKYDQMRLQALRDFEKDKPKADPDAWMNR